MDILNLDGLRYATQEHFTLTFGKLNNKPINTCMSFDILLCGKITDENNAQQKRYCKYPFKL